MQNDGMDVNYGENQLQGAGEMPINQQIQNVIHGHNSKVLLKPHYMIFI